MSEHDGTDDDSREPEESGSTLRTKLEEALAANKELSTRVSAMTADKVISDNGYDLVSADDLAGVSPDDIAEKAEALQQERLELTAKVLQGRLGIDDPDQVKALLEGQSDGEKEARRRIKEVGSTTGDAPRGVDSKFDGKVGPSRIAAALSKD